MNRANHSRRMSAIRACIASLLFVSLLGSFPASPTGARQASKSPTLELPAMVFTPTDLAAAGMPGYGVRWGKSGGPEALADIADDWNEQTTDGESKATLEGVGLRRSYLVFLYTKYNASVSGPDRQIRVSLHAFDSASGAAKGLAYLDELSATSTKVQRREGAGQITADAVLVWRPADGEDSETVLAVAFQVDRIIAVIEVSVREGQDPTVVEAETLATLLSQRIDAGLAGNTPGLGNMTPRIEGFSVVQDEYIRRDGEDFSSFIDNARDDGSGSGKPSEASLLARQAAAAGDAVEAYTVEQLAYELVPSLPFQFTFESRIYQFADEQAAVAWLDSRPDQIQAEASVWWSISNLEVAQGAPTYGEQSTSVTYLGGDLDVLPYKVFRVFLRVGNRTADIELVADERDAFPDTTIQAFASVQSQCLTVGCPEPILIDDALAGVIAVSQPQSVPATPVAQAIVDLGAMALTPADLAGLQMPGFGIGAASTTYPDEWMQSIGQNRGMTDDQVRAAVGSAGFLRRYDNELYLPTDVNDPTGEVGKGVITYLLEFSSDAGAAGVFDFLEDESGNSLAGDIPMSAPIGDQSEATHQTVFDPDTGEPFDLIDLTFRSGRFHAGVAMIDWQGQTVQLAQVELLAQRLLQRIQSVSSGSAPGLSNLVLRIGGPGTETVRDQYLLLNGQAIAQYGEPQQEVAGRETIAASEAQSDIYRSQQTLPAGVAGPEDDLTVLMDLYRFADEETASTWLAGIQGRISDNSAFTNVQFVAGPTFGDESVMYTLKSADGTVAYRGIAFRIGPMVAYLDISGSPEPPSLLALALADAQQHCLREGGCSTPFNLPAGLD